MATVKRSNPKAFETLDAKLKELEGVQAKVGWFSSAKYEDGTPVAYVAAIQELGHGPIPPRPYMRPTAKQERGKWGATVANGAKQVLAGKTTVNDVMQKIGSVAEGDVLQAIVDITTPPLSAITIQLRAMKKRNPDLKITGKTVGEAAAIVNDPDYVAPTDVSTKPLNDTGTMIATLTHVVEKTE